MSILTTNFVGQQGVNPRRISYITTDSYAQITAAGYFQMNSGILPTDFIFINYGDNSATFGIFTPSVSAGIMTLSPLSNAGEVTLIGSAVAGNLPKFYDTTGNVADSSIAANIVLTSSITTPNTNSNLVTFDVTVGQAALATGGSVTLYASTAAKQFKVRNLWINRGGTNFSGGGGDRLGQITDNTTVYSVIPATNMQTLINAGWGMSTPLPFPASAAINTSTAAGASLVFKYSGGTTDYTAGSIVVSGLLERVA
jgi:hypothetical protein